MSGTLPQCGGTAVQWPVEAIWEALAPQHAGFTVEVLAHIDSTNTELMRRARAGQVEPILLVAQRQSAGRGRLGRSWLSDDAVGHSTGALQSLTFSLGLPLHPADWSGLSLAVGLSLAQSLHPELRLKWPNDLWLGERKLAGVLIETVSVGPLRYAVIGVGINIAPRDPQGLSTPPAALCELLPGVDAPAALERVAVPLMQAMESFEAQGFAPLRQAFHLRDALYGRELLCSDGVCGMARGVDAAGALLVQTSAGLKKIISAEVSVRPTSAPAAPVAPHP